MIASINRGKAKASAAASDGPPQPFSSASAPSPASGQASKPAPSAPTSKAAAPASSSAGSRPLSSQEKLVIAEVQASAALSSSSPARTNPAASAGDKPPRSSAGNDQSPAGQAVKSRPGAASSAGHDNPKPAASRKQGGAAASASTPAAAQASSSQKHAASREAHGPESAATGRARAAASDTPAGDQQKPRGLAKGFLSGSTGLGMRAPSDDSSRASPQAHVPVVSVAVESVSRRVMLEIPMTWFSEHDRMGCELAEDLHNIRSMTADFAGSFLRRSSSIGRRVKNVDFLGTFVNEHLDRIRDMGDDVENIMSHLLSLEGVARDGPYMVHYVQDLQGCVQSIYDPLDEADSIESFDMLLVMYQASISHRSQACKPGHLHSLLNWNRETHIMILLSHCILKTIHMAVCACCTSCCPCKQRCRLLQLAGHFHVQVVKLMLLFSHDRANYSKHLDPFSRALAEPCL